MPNTLWSHMGLAVAGELPEETREDYEQAIALVRSCRCVLQQL
jgi:hypothetical protein